MNAQAWTKKRPKQAGWYWFKPKGGDARMVNVHYYPGDDDLSAEGWAIWARRWIGGEWQGPLVPNETRADARPAVVSDRPAEGQPGSAASACNLHDDCRAADEAVHESGRSGALHCYDLNCLTCTKKGKQ